MKSNSNRYKLMGLAFSLVLTFGIIINLRGQVAPLIQEDYGLSYSQLGFALSFLSVGGIFFNFLGGILIEKIGLKKVLLGGLLIVGAGVIMVSYSDTYLLLIAAMIILGIGVTNLNLTATSLISILSGSEKGKLMNFFHFFFGLGGIFAPLYANLILNLGFQWETTYLYSGGLVIVLLIMNWLSSFPDQKKEVNQKINGRILGVIKNPRVLLFIVMFLFYCGAELGVGSWLSLYLNDVQGRTQEEISFYLSAYFFFFTFGRLVASQLVEKVGYSLWIITASITAVLCIIVGMAGPDSAAIFFSLTGLALAGIFPTLQAIMFNLFAEDAMTTILGATLTAASVGFMVFGDWMVGFVNDQLGIGLGYGIVVIYLAIFLAVFLFLERKYN